MRAISRKFQKASPSAPNPARFLPGGEMAADAATTIRKLPARRAPGGPVATGAPGKAAAATPDNPAVGAAGKLNSKSVEVVDWRGGC